MKTSGGRRQTPVHPFHPGKGFHDGTSDDAEKFLRPPPHTTIMPLNCRYGARVPVTPTSQDRSVGSRRVCDTPYPLVSKGGLNA